MFLVPLAQAAKDGDGVRDVGLVYSDRLEATFECRVFLDVLAVFGERGRSDAVQLTTRQHRLEQVARVHRAFGRSGSDDGVKLVDEKNDSAFRFLNGLQHRLQPLLELTPILGAGDERAHVQ